MLPNPRAPLRRPRLNPRVPMRHQPPTSHPGCQRSLPRPLHPLALIPARPLPRLMLHQCHRWRLMRLRHRGPLCLGTSHRCQECRAETMQGTWALNAPRPPGRRQRSPQAQRGSHTPPHRRLRWRRPSALRPPPLLCPRCWPGLRPPPTPGRTPSRSSGACGPCPKSLHMRARKPQP
jgi:hypothetical protein